MSNLYMLFGGTECYYASGGANDLLKVSSSLNDLVIKGTWEKTEENIIEWWHIYSLKDEQIIVRSEATPYASDCGGYAKDEDDW